MRLRPSTLLVAAVVFLAAAGAGAVVVIVLGVEVLGGASVRWR
jgi:hypothetical protein